MIRKTVSLHHVGASRDRPAVPHLHCWGRSPCPGTSAPGSHLGPQPLLPPRPSPAPPGQRNGGGPAGPGRGRARMRIGHPSSAAAEVKVTTPRLLPNLRLRRFRVTSPTSGSAPRPPCPATAASRASRRRRGRQRGGRCRRMSR